MNSCVFVGNVGRDPETRTVGDNLVCNFSIAVRRSKKKGDDQDPMWVKCTAWGKTAEIAERFLRKGHQVCVSGTVDIETWKDKEGETRSDMTLNISSLSLLKNGDDSSQQDDRRSDTRRDDRRDDRRDTRRDEKPRNSGGNSRKVDYTW